MRSIVFKLGLPLALAIGVAGCKKLEPRTTTFPDSYGDEASAVAKRALVEAGLGVGPSDEAQGIVYSDWAFTHRGEDEHIYRLVVQIRGTDSSTDVVTTVEERLCFWGHRAIADCAPTESNVVARVIQIKIDTVNQYLSASQGGESNPTPGASTFVKTSRFAPGGLRLSEGGAAPP